MAPNATNGVGDPLPQPAGTAAAPALQPQFSIGSILRQTFSVYGSNWGAFFILMAVTTAVSVLGEVLLPGSVPWRRHFMKLFMDLIALVTQPLATGTIFFIVYEALHGRKASVPMGLRAASANLVQVVGASVLSYLAIAAGFLLCIVPGVIATGLLALVVPVAMQEKPGIMAALRRSAALARDYRGQVIGVLFTLWLIVAVPLIAIVWIVGSNDPWALYIAGAHPRALNIAGAAVVTVIGGLCATATALMYDRLRLREESSAAGVSEP